MNKSQQNFKQQAKKKAAEIDYYVDDILMEQGDLNLSPTEDYKVKTNFKFRFSIGVDLLDDSDLIRIVIDYHFRYGEDTILILRVRSDFKVMKYQEVVINKKVQNRRFLDYLIGHSVSHARALQSTVIRTTAIDGNYIPSIPQQLLKDVIDKNSVLDSA